MLSTPTLNLLSPTSLTTETLTETFLKKASPQLVSEWEPRRACWLFWNDDWSVEARQEFVSFCRAVSSFDESLGVSRGEKLEILVSSPSALFDAESALQSLNARFHLVPYGAVHLRDHAPVFVRHPDQSMATLNLTDLDRGGPTELPHDDSTPAWIVGAVGGSLASQPKTILPSQIETDGQGTALLPLSHLIAAQTSLAAWMKGVGAPLGIVHTIVLDDSEMPDWRKGRLDRLARFAGPGVLLISTELSQVSPHASQIFRQSIDFALDARGRSLQVIEIPHPRAEVRSSYLEFYISNSAVIVPQFEDSQDQRALARLSRWFPDRRTVGVNAV
ncbi:MAG: hypothetical protein EOP09_11575, partial [Proteobacteria bacterium]